MQEDQIVDSATLSWLRATVREALRLPESADVDTRTLQELGANSLQAIGLQFRILKETSANVEMEELAAAHVAEIATLIDSRRPAA